MGYLGERDPMEVQRSTPAGLHRLIEGRTRRALGRRPAPGKWSVIEILAHLADAELAMGFRLRSSIPAAVPACRGGTRTCGRESAATLAATHVARSPPSAPCARATSRFCDRCRAARGHSASACTECAGSRPSRKPEPALARRRQDWPADPRRRRVQGPARGQRRMGARQPAGARPIGSVDRYADAYCYMWYAKTYAVNGSDVPRALPREMAATRSTSFHGSGWWSS